ncbi:MAG: GAF domain-containing sensor histidine kinase [Solirubrobacterales bacterium]|nr:GAF domain-containing sensor histidine kinase [Solirubrobacterales bacterium]
MSPPSLGRLTRLAELSQGLVADLDPEAVLDQILDAAIELTGARYGALGILDESREEFAEFRTRGVDDATRARIGDLPRGHGVLGVLIDEQKPLRLEDVGAHPRSYGFPADHPVMRTFLGVPVRVRGEAWGNLYLAEKAGGAFTEADEELSIVFAAWAATAIELARLHDRSERRRQQLENAVRGLEAVRDVATAIGGETGFDRVLELIAKRGRALINSGSLAVLLREGEELVVAASAGDESRLGGLRLPIAGSVCGRVFEEGRAAQLPAERLAIPQANTGLLVPMSYRGKPLGLLAAFDSAGEGPAFSFGDEQLLGVFAATAANALAMAESVESDRLRSSMDAADHERGRWARELHDETLQGLGALRLLLAAALRSDDQAAYASATREAIEQVEEEIANLRAIISDLRPAALDELGLRPAIEALLRRRGQNGFSIESTLDLPDPELGEPRLAPDRESTVYRLVQEALTNIGKHANASAVHVEVTASAGDVAVEVRDNGTGFDAEQATEGFGLAGMRERVYLAGGTFALDSGPDGTRLRARLLAGQRGST